MSNAGSHGLISTQARALPALCAIMHRPPLFPNAADSATVQILQWKLASTEFMLLMSFLFFLQAIRLWSFLVRR